MTKLSLRWSKGAQPFIINATFNQVKITYFALKRETVGSLFPNKRCKQHVEQRKRDILFRHHCKTANNFVLLNEKKKTQKASFLLWELLRGTTRSLKSYRISIQMNYIGQRKPTVPHLSEKDSYLKLLFVRSERRRYDLLTTKFNTPQTLVRQFWTALFLWSEVLWITDRNWMRFHESDIKWGNET